MHWVGSAGVFYARPISLPPHPSLSWYTTVIPTRQLDSAAALFTWQASAHFFLLLIFHFQIGNRASLIYMGLKKQNKTQDLKNIQER